MTSLMLVALPMPIPVIPMLTTVQTVRLMAVPRMDTSAVSHTMSLGASLRDRATLSSPLRGLAPSGGYPSRLRSLRSLRAPLARRLASLTAACRTASPAQRSTNSLGPPPRSPRACASHSARRRPRLARPGRLRRLRASPRLAPVHPVRRRVPASPRTARCTRADAPAERARTSLRTVPCSSARTSASTTARASGSVLRTTACGSVRTVRHSIAVTAPLRRVPRRRFPHRSYRRFGRPDRPGRPWVPHPTHLWCSARRAAYAPPPVPMSMILRTLVAAWRAGNRATNLVAP